MALIALLGVGFLLAPASALGKKWVFSSAFGTAGSGDGQLSLRSPTFEPTLAGSGLAVSEASHDIYVADTGNHRIDQFSAAGTFIRAFGADVGGAGIDVCSSGCVAGTSASAPGAFEDPTFVAVDNSGGLSNGNVYVADTGADIVSKFEADGTLISSWGAGGQLAGNGSEAFAEIVGIAVDASGGLSVMWAVNNPGHLSKFDQAGVLLGEVETPRGSVPVGLAVDPAGNFFKANGTRTIEKFESSGTDLGQVTLSSLADNLATGLGVDPSNGEFFSDNGKSVENYAFDPAGKVVGSECALVPDTGTGCPPTSTFGSGKLSAGAGLAVDGISHTVYVADVGAAQIAVFEPVALPEALNAPADPVGATSATLHGTVNPGGLPLTECFFEWGETQSYGEIAPCVDPDAAAVGEGNAPVPVHADIADLQAGTTYHFHLVATNANGRSDEEGKEDETLRTLGPAVSGESVSQVTATTAKISATIDPNGEATGFFVEYLDEAAYLANPESERFAGALRAPASDRQVPAAVSAHGDLLDGSASVTNVAVSAGAFQAGQAISGPDIPPETTILAVPSPTELTLSKPADLTTETVKFTALTATGPQPVTQLLSGLAPQSTYYFRIVATNGAGAAARPAVSFTTFALPGALLPDGRAYELISPARKTGEVFAPEPESFLGSCEECLPGENTPVMPMQSTPDGRSVLYEGQPFAGGLASGPNEYVSARGTGGWDTQSLSSPTTTGQYQAFSADLARGVLFQVSPPLTPQAPTREGKGFANLYLRTGDGSLQALIGSEPPHRDPGYQAVGGNQFRLTYATANAGTGAAAPFTHLAFEANDALTAAVPAIAPAAPNVDAGEGCSLAGANCNLYEWAGGQLRLVNVLPGNAAAAAGAVIGSGRLLAEAPEAEAANADHAISEDGSRIFWSSEESGQVYVRIDANRTLEVPGPGSCKESVPQEQRACFLSASADGSRVLLSDGQAYELNEAGSAYEASVDLSEGEGGFEGILGASEDLSHVYFVDTEVLGEGEENDNGEEAEEDAFNLYARSGSETTFIGALLDDTVGLKRRYGAWKAAPSDRLAQVSPDGAHLAFMSTARLTSYDNASEWEVFEYSAASGTLSCASCNPSGQRPLGPSNLSLLRPGPESPPFRQPANLSPAGDGRLFFESRDALSPQDTNGVRDVYEWEPEGVGSCERAGGCVSLISSGRSANDSMFLDSTPSGDDAFFITREQLLPADKDEQLDLYDARVGGGFPESTAAPCGGEACKAPLLAPPFQPSPASAAFSGPGNPKPKPHKKKKQKKHKKKQKQHSRAAKHARGSLR